MKQRKTVLLFSVCAFLIFSFELLNSLVIETNRLSQIKEHLEEEVLIVFDIDNTLIEPMQKLGSDQWAWNRVRELNAMGIDESNAFMQTMDEWRQIHRITKMQTLEKDTPDIIKELQSQGYLIIGLTTREPQDADLTIRELKEVGIDLASTAISDENRDIQLKKMARFTQGILFTTLENKKSIALKEFLNQVQYRPKKLLFVDDKLSHVKDLEEFCEREKIDYIGVRYGVSDSHVAAFDPVIAKLQWFFLQHILSDEEAKVLKEIRSEKILTEK